MKAPRFAYARPASIAEAMALLQKHGDDARVLAGGQSLVPMLNFRLAAPKVLVDISRIESLAGIKVTKSFVRIGALARHVDLERSADVAKHLPLVASAIPHIGHPAIRNRGTFGGSCALADPAAELPACALALGATFVVAGKKGERRIAAGDFFKGLYATALKPGELLVAAAFPLPTPSYASACGEPARRPGQARRRSRTTRRPARFRRDETPSRQGASRPRARGARRMNAPLETVEIEVTVNGERVKRSVPARLNLADFLRN